MTMVNRDGDDIPQKRAYSFRWTWTRLHCVRFLRPWCTSCATCPRMRKMMTRLTTTVISIGLTQIMVMIGPTWMTTEVPWLFHVSVCLTAFLSDHLCWFFLSLSLSVTFYIWWLWVEFSTYPDDKVKLYYIVLLLCLQRQPLSALCSQWRLHTQCIPHRSALAQRNTPQTVSESLLTHARKFIDSRVVLVASAAVW